jgi:glycosyltransferase involved in cell wall biosynthesis
MKILHIDTRPDWRGGQLQVLLTLRGQRARGHDAQLMARRDSPLAQRASREGLPVHYIPSRFLRVRAALCLREILDQQAFDIVHAHDPHALTAAWLAGAHRRACLVVSRRVAYPLSRGRIGLARYRAAPCIIAVSQFVARSVNQSGVDARAVAVVYDGVEIPAETKVEERRAARARWNIGEDEFLLGCVGYLLPEKGQEVLLRALPAIRREFPSCRLIFAGDGPCRGSLEALARELSVAEAVIFGGFIQDVAEVYRALDLFLLPSLAEPLGTSLLAAMSYALPVVATASGGVPEVVVSGKNGILVSASQASTLEQVIRLKKSGTQTEAHASAEQQGVKFADAIRKVLSDPALAARLGKAARQTIIDHFSADVLVERTLEQYRKVLSRK